MNVRINVKVATVSIVVMLMLATLMIMAKPVKAEPDKFYLNTTDGTHKLITTQPTGNGMTVTLGPGQSFTRTWYSDTYTQDQTINEGSYNLKYWIARKGVNTTTNFGVRITFEFGYYKDGTHYEAWSCSERYRVPYGWTTPQSRVITVSYTNFSIPSGAQLYLNVTISPIAMPDDEELYFYYGGYIDERLCDTSIETPTVSVPEFPAGIFLLPPMLLTIYLILRRRTP